MDDSCPACEADATCDAPVFTPNGDDTVSSSCCGLDWQQKFTPGSEACGDGPAGAAETACYSWTNAQAFCGALDLAGGGWRLPSLPELLSLVRPTDDAVDVDAEIDLNTFPDTRGIYWTTARYTGAGREGYFAWNVNFDSGGETMVDPTRAYRVRCVR